MHYIYYENEENGLGWYMKEMDNHYLMLNDNVFKPILKTFKDNPYIINKDIFNARIELLDFYYYDMALNHIKKESKEVCKNMNMLHRILGTDKKHYLDLFNTHVPGGYEEDMLRVLLKISTEIDLGHYKVKTKCCPTIFNCMKKSWRLFI